jgi:hypothetical protein
MDKSKDISCLCKTRTSRRFYPSKSYENDFEGALKFFIRLAEENFVIHVRDACILFVTLHSRTF